MAARHRFALGIRRRAASRKAIRALRHALIWARAMIARLRRPALLVAGVVVLATFLGAGAFAATAFYGDYGAPRTPVSVRSWQLRPPSYLASDCADCHSDTAAAARAEPHAQVSCEACHVPSVDHPGPIEGVVEMLPAPAESDCVTCHSIIPGRPQDFTQVAPDRHYFGAECLSCHDPHTSLATTPVEVFHPLANLPSCSTCHAPLGLKTYPANHEPAEDDVCLSCHKPGAGGQ